MCVIFQFFLTLNKFLNHPKRLIQVGKNAAVEGGYLDVKGLIIEINGFDEKNIFTSKF